MVGAGEGWQGNNKAGEENTSMEDKLRRRVGAGVDWGLYRQQSKQGRKKRNEDCERR